jgi:hypothetical protein
MNYIITIGKDWAGPTCCRTGATCDKIDAAYSLCQPVVVPTWAPQPSEMLVPVPTEAVQHTAKPVSAAVKAAANKKCLALNKQCAGE